MEMKPQFDSYIGGTVQLPPDVDYMSFAKSRTQEIIALSKAIAEPKRNGLVFQQLPRHMRRRVMGHNSKRVPRIVREAHQRQLEKSGLPPPSKRPSRKHRRRPQNLLTEYNRRQKSFMWLETHIWHAKRFHMIGKWGYKIANFPNDKSFRACYRASSQHCLLQDLSYYSCLELSGSQNHLLEKLKLHTSQECGLTFGARSFLNGTREGNVTLFRQGMFPNGVIGNVSFLWKPQEKKVEMGLGMESDERTLWIWIHPAFYTDVLEELVFTLKLEIDNSSDLDVPEAVVEVKEESKLNQKVKARAEKKVEETKLATRNVPFIRTPKYVNDDGVKMILLKDTLNRFRLTGPLSQAILVDALKPVDTLSSKPSKAVVSKTPVIRKTPAKDIDEIFALMSEPTEEKVESQDSDTDACETTAVKESDWWTKFFSESSFHRDAAVAQRDVWQKLGVVLSPAQLPPHIVIGMNVRDPRLDMPEKRKKALPDESKPWQQGFVTNLLLPEPSVCASALWSSSVRDVATRTKLPVSELNRERSGNLVPGFVDSCQGSANHSRIPVLLIQRPGSQQSDVKRLGFGSGWDVIVPAGWGMPLWLGLVFRGARVGGLREAVALGREASDVATLPPDSMAGRREADATRERLTDKYFRLPPDKRPNFIKLGITNPFSCPWDSLVREWWCAGQSEPSGPAQCTAFSSPFFILRNKKTLALFQLAMRGKRSQQSISDVDEAAASLRTCLVPITLSMVQKGKPVDFSIICMPSDEDLKCFADDPSYAGPMEVQHLDVHMEERKELRKEHQTVLKRLRKQRVRKNRKEREGKSTKSEANDESNVEPAVKKRKPHEPVNEDLANTYAAENRALWLPENLSIKDSSSRCVIGYVTQGDFSFIESSGAAVGYVIVAGLVRLIAARADRKPVYVLVRNPTSCQYRFARLDVKSDA